MKPTPRQLRRILVAIVLGMIGGATRVLYIPLVEGAAFGIGILPTLFLPLVVAWAWGWRHGFLAALAGCYQSMWWPWPRVGCGFLYAAPAFTLWVVWHGWWAERRRRSAHHPWYQSVIAVEVPFRIMSLLGFYTVFRWLISHNPPPWMSKVAGGRVPLSWFHEIAVRQTFVACVLLLAAYATLSVGPVRRFFGLRSRSAAHGNGAIYACAFLLSLLLWVVDACVEHLTSHPVTAFWSKAMFAPGAHDMLMRLLHVVLLLTGAMFLVRYHKHRALFNARLGHLNRVLRAVRNVNQLITREPDRERLLDGVCQSLVETRGLFNCWIALVKDGKPTEPFFHAGIDDGDFAPMAESLRAGLLPPCARLALDKENGIHTLSDPPSDCADCPSAMVYEGRSGLAVRLEHDGHTFGWLTLSAPRAYADDTEEQSLLTEVADDIAYALWAIETQAEGRRAEKRYEDVLATTSDAVILLDTEDNIVFFNASAERHSGCRQAEALGSPISRFCLDDQRTRLAEVLQRVQEQQAVVGAEMECLHADGRRIPVEVTFNLRTDGEGITIGTTAILRDITERKRAERELMASEAQKDAILNGINSAILFLSESLDVLWVNQAAVVLSGMAEEKIVGSKCHAICGRSEKECVDCPALKAFHTEKTSRTIMRLPDGRILDVKAEPVFDRNGAVLGMVEVLQDITDKRKAELEIRRFKTIFDSANYGCAITSMDGEIEYINDSFAAVHGYSPDELSNVSVFHNDEQMETIPEIVSSLEEAGHYGPVEVWHTHRDGTVFPMMMNGVLVKDLHGETEFVAMMAIDISMQKRAEKERDELAEQSRQASKVESIGRLAGGVAHDMNNLLSPIIGYGEMLLAGMDVEDEDREFMEEIVQAGFRARDLVRQLLAFSRKQILEYKPMDVCEVVTGLERMLRRTIREDIELKIVPTRASCQIKADVGQIEQVILNLAINAADAMPQGGLLTLDTTLADLDEDYAKHHRGVVPGAYVMLAVSDTGCGMDDKTIEHIFEPFFSTKGELGTGLGLATVQGIVAQHSGSIQVDSELGKGTTFKVYLPVSHEAPGRARDVKDMGTSVGGSETILLTEDEEMVRHVAKAILEGLGYTVLEARNGAEGLAILDLHDGPVHLLLTDVVMPGLNSREVFAKAAEKHPGLKVLYMSGYTDNVIGEHGVLDERTPFIHKPFTPTGLASKMREVLG
jgi:PAS domain S-box-containing protein